jgi:hypothetical protein
MFRQWSPQGNEILYVLAMRMRRRREEPHRIGRQDRVGHVTMVNLNASPTSAISSRRSTGLTPAIARIGVMLAASLSVHLFGPQVLPATRPVRTLSGTANRFTQRTAPAARRVCAKRIQIREGPAYAWCCLIRIRTAHSPQKVRRLNRRRRLRVSRFGSSLPRGSSRIARVTSPCFVLVPRSPACGRCCPDRLRSHNSTASTSATKRPASPLTNDATTLNTASLNPPIFRMSSRSGA